MNNLTLDDFDFDDCIYDQFDNENDVKLHSANVISYNCPCYGYGNNPPPVSEIPIPAAFYEFMRRKILVEHPKSATTRGKGRGRGRGRDASLRRPGVTNTAGLPLHSPDDTGLYVDNIDRPSADINTLDSDISLPAASKADISVHHSSDVTGVHVANTLPPSDISYSNDSVKSKVLSWLSQTSPSQNDSRLECLDADTSYKPDTFNSTDSRDGFNVEHGFNEADPCRKPSSWCSTPENFPSDVEESFEVIQPVVVKKVDKESLRKFRDSFLNDDNGNAGGGVKEKLKKSPVSLMDVILSKDRQSGQNVRSDISSGNNVAMKQNTQQSTNNFVNKSPLPPRFRQESSRSSRATNPPRPPRFNQNRNEEMHRRLNFDTTNGVINRGKFSPPKDWNLQSCNMRAALKSGFALNNDDEDLMLRARQGNGDTENSNPQNPAGPEATEKKTSYEEHFPSLGGGSSNHDNKNDIKKTSSQASLSLKSIASNLSSK